MADIASLEVFRHRLSAVAEEMGATLQRAAYSANIKERLDFSCAVFDADGRLLAQAAHIPVHLGAMPASVAAARAAVDGWRSGDVVILNDPFAGGSHLPDITTVSPVFVSGSDGPAAFVATRAHHADVGGAEPGSMPLVRERVAEGLIIPPIHLARAGVIDAALMNLIAVNSRTPEERRGDLAAQLAAQRTGAIRMAALIDAPAADFAGRAEALLSHSARLSRARLKALGQGAWPFRDYIEGDGFDDADIPLHVVVTLDTDGSFTADFTGTAEQTDGPMNAPFAVTCSAVYYVVACLLGDVPVNAGAFEPVAVIAPSGSLVNPVPPAAVAAGNVETSQRIVDVVFGALQQAAPQLVPAASQGTMNNLVCGGHDPLTGRPFTYYETVGGGGGGGPTDPGASSIQVHMTNTRNTPIEALELAYPLRVLAYRRRIGSGGAGLHPGGDGIERHIEFLAPARVTLLADRRRHGPWGAAGGLVGAPGEHRLRQSGTWSPLGGKVAFDVLPGDELLVRTPGGGGWGEPSATSEPDLAVGE